ncbi:hypothetical protein GT037_000249 [Alternaria burnsii]|uniref:Uncharacterized protein n=1 Tax=Alternaria burnsii TaxID=1187904 RepID=A0A8H7BGS4_9PLEO|nr:uncharacterized protein GT037_000249 [Alternaria burnsii]KAF7681273.1 hypothetical protein GT037_000249 [Alternaria burnsii]
MLQRMINVWQEPVNYDILSPECIMRRMDLEKIMSSEPVRILITALNSFGYAQDLGDAARGRGRFAEGTMR